MSEDQKREQEILAVEAEIDQLMATFRESGNIPDVDTLQRRVMGGYMQLLINGIPANYVLGGSAAALAVAVRRLAKHEITNAPALPLPDPDEETTDD